MGIKLLSEGVWSRIAAGEVVERPASAVKEMIENSLDAGATRIRVKLWDGGRVRIVVEDNGSGIAFGELPLALTPHATSKISGIEDLEAILTLGYRGEALASLAAVAKVEIRSRAGDGGTGGVIRAYEGRVTDHAETNCTPGTRVQVDEIFSNLPARRKFLKSASGELRRAASLIREYAICRPEVAFALEHDARVIFSTDGSGRRRRAIEQLWGSEPRIQNVAAKAGRIALECWWQPRTGPGGRNEIASFVNGRSVTDPVIKGAVSAAARELTGGWALFFSVDPSLVDVNIHPAKAEIRFRYPGDVFDALKEAADKLGAPASMDADADARGGGYENFAAGFPSPEARSYPTGEPYKYKSEGHKSEGYGFQTAAFRASPADSGASSGGGLFARVETPDFDLENESLTGEAVAEAMDDSAEYLGQLTSGYLIFDGPDGLMVVDPHAAHERVAYERIKAAAKEDSRSQSLLVPSPIPPTLQLDVEEKRELLEKAGFAMEASEGGINLTAAPYLAGASVPPEALLRGAIAALREGNENTCGPDELLWRSLATMACKDAVKVTTKLRPEEAAALWDDLHGCQQPFYCPHGRPTILKFPAADLRKRFGRE